MQFKKIQDEFTDLPISRQRKYKLRMEKSGRCTECGEPAVSGGRCVKHLVEARERRRKLIGAKRRYHNTLGYHLQEQGMKQEQEILEKSSPQESSSTGEETARKPIQDEFSHLPISRQRRYQLRRQRDQKCMECGDPVIAGERCLKHLIEARERRRKKRKDERRYVNTSAYQLQNKPEAVKQVAKALRKLKEKKAK